MNKSILAAVFILIIFSPLSQAWSGGYSSVPAISFGINLGIPSYSEVWVPGHWIRIYGDWVWIEGYWGKRLHEREYRSIERRRPLAKAYWVPGHWERRYRDRVWVSGYWKKKDRPRYDYLSRKQGKRAGRWKIYRNSKDLW
jgi:hypothetical protein